MARNTNQTFFRKWMEAVGGIEPLTSAKAGDLLGVTPRMIGKYKHGANMSRTVFQLMDAIQQGYRPRHRTRHRREAA